MAQFKVQVNPFTREVIIKTTINDVEHLREMFYKDVDEWNSFTIEDKIFDIHFDYYDDEFSVSIYPYTNEDDKYKYLCQVELTIKLNDK